MKSWAVRVTVELLIDDQSVGSRRETMGAFVEHVPLDKRTLIREAGVVGRRAAKRVAESSGLLP